MRTNPAPPAAYGGPDPNPFHRWEHRADRLQLMRWLRAPRVGYAIYSDAHRPSFTVEIPRYSTAFEIYYRDLSQHRGGWRRYVAWALRAIRNEARTRERRLARRFS